MAEESGDGQVPEMGPINERPAQKDWDFGKVKTSRRLFDVVFGGVSDDVMIVDAEFNIREVNRAFLDRYGLHKFDVLGRKCYSVKEHAGGPCSLRDKKCPLEQAKKTGSPVEMIHPHQPAEGDVREFVLMMYPFSGEGGQVDDFFVEIAREVTDYPGLIRKLQSSEERFRAILDTATNAILSIDESHRIVLFNNAAQKMFGYSRHEILGQDLTVLIPARYGEHESFVHRFLEKKDSKVMGKTFTLTALRRGGEEFPIELSLSCMELASKTTFTATIRDLSEKQHLETKLLQTERLAAVGQAVAHVAHEIKNPLMIIGGFSCQMKKGLTSKKDFHKLDMILEEVGRLERLVAGIGDFTKTYHLVKRMTNVNEIIKDVVQIMSEVYPPDIYGFHEQFSLDIREIHCDPDKLKQVFINIISNGFEAMREGGDITVATDAIPAGVEVRISDEGVGITEDELHHIFEPFYTTRERGSGLGLSISYKIVEAHEGDISAHSRPGQGTTFIIRLPAY